MPKENASSEIVEGNVQMPTIFERLVQRMEMDAALESGEANSTLIMGVEKILSADSEDEMWDADDLQQIGGRDLCDVEQEIHSFAIRFGNNPTIESAFVDSKGRKMYLLIKSVRLENGEEFQWNTSAPLVVAKLIWLEERGMLPYSCVIRGTDLGGAKTVLKLKKIPRRAVPSK